MCPETTFDPVETAFDEQGSGVPLVLVSGLASGRRDWHGFDRLLATFTRTVTFDNRGIGDTPRGRSPYTLRALASDIVRLLDRLHVERAHVFGISMGGMIALELAARHPDRIGSLLLGCTHPGGALQVLPTKEILGRLTSAGKTTMQMAEDFVAITHASAFSSFRRDLVEQTIEQWRASGFSRRTYVSQLGAIRAHDVCSRLACIECPTLVLAGTDDQLVPPENARILAERMPNAELLVLQGIGHAFWIEAPIEASSHVRRFLASRKVTEKPT